MQPNISIQLFGGPKIKVGNRTITKFRTQKTALILAQIAHAPHPLNRSQLAQQHWPETDPATARKSLTVSLSSLRKILEPKPTPPNSILITDRDTVFLPPESVHTDTRELLQLLTQHQATSPKIIHLLSQVQDQLLPGFIDDWSQSLREELAIEFAHYAHQAIATPANTSERRAWIAQKWLNVDPYSDRAATNLLDSLIQLGRVQEALTHARAYRDRLAQDLQSRPSQAFLDLVQQLKNPPKNPPVPTSPTGPKHFLITNYPNPNLPNQVPNLKADQEISAFQIPTLTEAEALAQLYATPPYFAKTFTTELQDPNDLASAIQNQANSTIIPTQSPKKATLGAWPQYQGQIFGREDDIETLIRKLQDPAVRQISLIGLGGIGKTRLATALALHPEQPASTIFLSLQTTGETPNIPLLLVQAANISSLQDPLEDLIRHFHQKPVLLVLDNCETAPQTTKEFLNLALLQWPTLKVIVTSRHPIKSIAEKTYNLPPLSTEKRPDPNAAVSLFVQAAQSVKSDFALTPKTTPLIQEICQQLQGFPLSLEIAGRIAARQALSTTVEHLKDQLNFLKKPVQNPQDPQSSVQSTIAWAFNQAPEDQKQNLATLSAFAQTGTDYSLQKVLNLDSLSQATEILQLAQNLGLAHLSPEPESNHTRFNTLHVVHQFLQAQTKPSNLNQTLANFWTEWCLAQAQDFNSPEQAVHHNRVARDYDNIIAALNFLKQDPKNHQQAFQLAEALWRHWDVRRPILEAFSHLIPLSELESPATPAYSCVIMRIAHFYLRTGQLDKGIEYNKQVIRIREEIGDPYLIAGAYGQYASILINQGEYMRGAEGHLKTAQFFKQAGEPLYYSIALSNRGSALRLAGQLQEAKSTYQESLEVRREIQDYRGIASSNLTYTNVLLELEEWEELAARAQEALAAARVVQDIHLTAISHAVHANYCYPNNPQLQAKHALIAQAFVDQGALPLEDEWDINPTLKKAEKLPNYPHLKAQVEKLNLIPKEIDRFLKQKSPKAEP